MLPDQLPSLLDSTCSKHLIEGLHTQSKQLEFSFNISYGVHSQAWNL